MSRSLRSLIRHGVRNNLTSKAGFSRRDFLYTGAKFSAAAMLASALGGVGGCASTDRPSDSSKQGAAGKRVVIVGAGFAGLACAQRLMERGADVTVLEADPRPGGRVLSDRTFLPGQAVELGGEFIGTNHPHWIAFAQHFALELIEAAEYEGDDPIIINGKLLRGAEADALFAEVDGGLAQLIELARTIDPVRPYLSPDAAEMDARSFKDAVDEMKLSETASAFMIASEEADNGVQADRMSLLAYLAMVAGGGYKDYYELSETHRLDGGNDRLATAFANSLGRRVRFNSPVISISRTSSHAVVTTATHSFECDEVVLAVPPSVWNRIKFKNGLNGQLPQMGRNVKLLLKVTTPVWEGDNLTPELSSDGLVQLTWVSGELPEGGPKSLTLFSGGDEADKLRDLSRDERLQQAFESVKPAYPKLAEVTTEDRFMDWPSMPRVMASYSFPAPGQVTTLGPLLIDGPNDNLAPLHFAGEHTSYSFIGYMEGALESGVRVAKAILRIEDPTPENVPATMPV